MFSGINIRCLSLPFSVSLITMFVAFLSDTGLKATYLSAMGFIHKINGFPDPTDHFLVQKIMTGLRRRQNVFDIRLPITHDILHQLVDALHHIIYLRYNRFLLISMFLLAYAAYLRVGEITSSGSSSCILMLRDLRYEQDVNNMYLCIRQFKHHYTDPPHTCHIRPSPNHPSCPVHATLQYLQLRGSSPGPLFCHQIGMPVSRALFTKVLAECLKFSGSNLLVIKATVLE